MRIRNESMNENKTYFKYCLKSIFKGFLSSIIAGTLIK